MIATLGTESQVITTALDLLRQQGEDIRQVIVLHTSSSDPAITSAVKTLQTVFKSTPYQNKVTLHLCPLKDSQGALLEDVETVQSTRHAFRMLYQQVQMTKRAGYKVHLSIAGGRKNLAVFGMVVAQMLFEEEDRLWHIYSGEKFLESKRLHPKRNDDAHLIPIPVILWSQVSPVFTDLGAIDNPFQAVERIQELQFKEKIEMARTFVLGSLSPAERRVVEWLVREGLSDQELSEKLYLSPRTVEQHLRSSYVKAADHWTLVNVNRTQLIALLNLYYSTRITGKPA